jgi:hypothetical protein
MSESCERPTGKETVQKVDIPKEKLNTYKLDASANGCTGMFWRTGPVMDNTSKDSSWPRNGAILHGWEPENHSGWVQFDNGFWMPISQHGKVVCHKQ